MTKSITTQSATAGPGYQQPTKGDCRNLTLTQFRAKTNTTSPVSCTATHTAQTIHVGDLPKRLSWKSPKTRVSEAIESRCRNAWRAAVGRSAKLRSRSAFELATFRPTKAQRSNGARWFRCDAALRRGTSLTPMTTTRAPPA